MARHSLRRRRGQQRAKGAKLRLEILEIRSMPSVLYSPSSTSIAFITGAPDHSNTLLTTNEPSIAIDPNNPSNFAVTAQGGWAYSTDDGADFNTGSFPQPTGYGNNDGDTWAAYDAQSQLFQANLVDNGTQSAAVAMSHLNTSTPPTSKVVDQPTTNVGDDRLVMAADSNPNSPFKNYLYVIWSGNGINGPIRVSHSQDGGKTWVNTQTIGTEPAAWQPSIAVGPNGYVYASYHSQPGVNVYTDSKGNKNSTVEPNGTSGEVFVAVSKDGGKTWTFPTDTSGNKVPVFAPGQADITWNVQAYATNVAAKRLIPGARFLTAGSSSPVIVPDPARPGRVYCIVASDPTQGGTSGDLADLYISNSTDYGSTWSTPTTLESGPDNSFQLFPTAAADKYGNMVVAWYDNRNFAKNSSGDYLLDVYAKYSTDGGQTWSGAFQVNKVNNPLDPFNGAPVLTNGFPSPPNTYRIGEYISTAILGGTAYVAWTGNSFDNFGAINGQQIYWKAFPLHGSITVDPAANENVTLQTMPGNSKFFEVFESSVSATQPVYTGLWNSIVDGTNFIEALGGNDTVKIRDLPVGVSLTIDTSGPTTVDIAPGGDLTSVKGKLNVFAATPETTVNINDSEDAGQVGRTVTIAPGNMADDVTFSQIGTIGFQTSLAALNITANNYGNTFLITGGPNLGAVTLNTGTAGDKVTVESTMTPITINGTGGQNTVTLGNSTNGLEGMLAGLAGVTIKNTAGSTDLTVDDSAGKNPTPNSHYWVQTDVEISATQITGLAPATIDYSQANLTSLVIKGGSAGITYTVTNTPSNERDSLITTLDTGNTISNTASGKNTVTIESVSDALIVNGVDGSDGVTLGNNGLLDSFFSDVTLNKVGNITLADSLDPNSHPASAPVTITSGSISGLTGGTIYYDQSLLTSLNINVGYDSGFQTSSVYDVQSTPNFVHLPGQAGSTTTNLTTDGTGGDTVNVGLNGSLAGIAGPLYLDSGAGQSSVIMDDSKNRTAEQPSVQQFLNFEQVDTGAPAAIYLFNGDISSATLDLGTPFFGQNTATVYSTTPDGPSITIVGGSAGDTADIQGNSSAVTVQNFANVNLGNQSQVLGINGGITANNDTKVTVDDSMDPTGRDVTIDGTTASGFPGSATPWLTYSGVAQLVIDGSTKNGNGFTVNDTAPGANTSINTGMGTVTVLGSTGPLSVAGGFLIQVGQGITDNIRGNVTVTNPNPSLAMALTVDASQDATMRAATLDKAVVNSQTFETVSGLTGPISSPSTIYYQGDQNIGLTVDGSDKVAGTFLVNTTGSSPATVNTGIGTTTVVGTVGPLSVVGGSQTTIGNGMLNGIQGTVTVSNPLFSNAPPISLVVDDSQDSKGALPTIAPVFGGLYAITGLTPAPAAIDFVASAVKSPVKIKLAPSAQLQKITTIPAGLGQVEFDLANGGTLELGGSGTLDGIQSPVLIRGAGNNTVVFGDDQVTISHTYTLAGASLARDGVAPITLNLASGTVKLEAGSGGNTIYVKSAASGVSVEVSAGAGGDTVDVGSDANTLDPVQAAVTVNGSGGNTTLNVFDQGTSSLEEYDLHTTAINRTPINYPNLLGPPTQTINYFTVSKVNVHGGAGSDIYGCIGTLAGTTTALYGSGRGNEFIVENVLNRLDDIQGPLTVHGGGLDYLSVVDGGNTIGHTYTMTTGKLTRDGMADINYDGIGEFVVTSAGNNFGHTSSTINVQSFNVVFAILVVAKGDVITVGQNGSMANILGDLRIQGTIGQTPKQITLDDSADTTGRTITLRGADPTFGYLVSGLSPNGGRIGFVSLDPTTPVSILGGTGDDVFQVHDFKGAPAISLVAEPASSTRSNMHNKLDYSAYTGSVLVSLPLGYATGFSSVSGIQDVTGSIGNNLLVGDTHPNMLIGGTGRNVLIAGGGGDTLDAHLGQGDNILIGGRTDWDKNLAALEAIMNEWDRTDIRPRDSFQARYDDLLSGTGTTNPLNTITVNGKPQFVLLTPATNRASNNGTVHSDGSADTLIGSTLTDPATNKRVHNWYFFDEALDTLVNFLQGHDHKHKVR